MGLAYRITSWGKSLPARADDGERRLFSGETADVIDDLSQALRASQKAANLRPAAE